MRFLLQVEPMALHQFTASSAAEVLFGVLDGIALYAPKDGPDPISTLSVEHTRGSEFSGVWLPVWEAILPTEPARLVEYLEGPADDVPSGAQPCTRAEALYSRAVGVRLAEIKKGR